MKFISKDDINRMKLAVSTKQEDNEALAKREHLKALSDKRISGWNDTLESKRKSKLRWKQEVLDREEEKRQMIDKKEAEIRNKLNQQTIQKAKALQYEENERVRLLRSQQLYTDVIETRQQQLQEKKLFLQKKKEEERDSHSRTMASIQATGKKYEEEQLILKQNAIKNARAMEAQKLENERRSKLIKDKRMKEEKELIRKVELEKEKERKLFAKRKEQTRTKAKEGMEKLALDVQRKQKEEEAMERVEEERRKKDLERAKFIAISRANLEAKHFEERQAARKILSDKASKALEMRASREVELFIRDQKAQEAKERERKEKETQKAQELEKAVHESRKKQIMLAEEKRRKEKECDAIFAAESTEKCLKELAQEKMKEAERRNRNLKYRKLQEEQSEAAKQKSAAKRQEGLEEERTVAKKLANEDDLFREFAMKEMERFKSQGKSTDLLNKVLFAN